MIKHIVCWKLADHADGRGKAENALLLKSKLEDLAGRIPGLLKVETGINFNAIDGALDVALVSEFATRADLESYQNHPLHREVAGWISTIRTARYVVDYEV